LKLNLQIIKRLIGSFFPIEVIDNASYLIKLFHLIPQHSGSWSNKDGVFIIAKTVSRKAASSRNLVDDHPAIREILVKPTVAILVSPI